ncbi:hypothetical protein COU60_03730 [Candidatus Pacearchaeota archaeon CG10_big_fil_rev_8_21_14_0_10_34_76]|nr:MAG: hypothetical protein COU60_03730 [Candidatus Pacearchaeota archaeon CG10_big_fil_rev_8_21_14_0_10_34_76]
MKLKEKPTTCIQEQDIRKKTAAFLITEDRRLFLLDDYSIPESIVEEGESHQSTLEQIVSSLGINPENLRLLCYSSNIDDDSKEVKDYAVYTGKIKNDIFKTHSLGRIRQLQGEGHLRGFDSVITYLAKTNQVQ